MVSELVSNFLEKKQLLPPAPSPRGKHVLSVSPQASPTFMGSSHTPSPPNYHWKRLHTHWKFCCGPDKGQEHRFTPRSIEHACVAWRNTFLGGSKTVRRALNWCLQSCLLLAYSWMRIPYPLRLGCEKQAIGWREEAGNGFSLAQMCPVRPFTVQRGWWSLWMLPLRAPRAKQPVPGFGSPFHYLSPQQQCLFLPREKSWSGLLPSWLDLAKSTNAN